MVENIHINTGCTIKSFLMKVSWTLIFQTGENVSLIGMWYALVFQGRLTVIFESIMERDHIMCELFSVKGGITKHIGIHSEEKTF